MPCTCFSVIWTLAENFKQLSKWTEFFPLLLSIFFSFWKNTAVLPSTPDQKVERWGLWYANEVLLSALTFVIKLNWGEVRWKGGNSPPSTPFSITSPLKHIGLPKPPFFSFRSKGYTQQRKACVEKKKRPVHTSVYFYTVKSIDWPTAPKVCAHLYSMCARWCRDSTVSWWGCRLLCCLGRTEVFAITKHCRKAFMSPTRCDRIRMRTHKYTHTHYTRRDWVLSNTHRNMHMVAPLFNLHTV